jgi:hypothetical protein
MNYKTIKLKQKENDKMNKFTFEISDGFFPQKFRITIEAATVEKAEKEAREVYAEDLGTSEDQLVVKLISEK